MWISQFCFSLGFLFQNSLWKHFTFRGYKRYLDFCGMECEESVFQNKADWLFGLAAWLSHEFKMRVNWMASLDFLSCSVTAGMTVQLLYMFHLCASFSSLPVASHPWYLVASPWFSAQSWAFLHTFSHTILTWFPPKYRVSKCWITSKLARNKANKMVD